MYVFCNWPGVQGSDSSLLWLTEWMYFIHYCWLIKGPVCRFLGYATESAILRRHVTVAAKKGNKAWKLVLENQHRRLTLVKGDEEGTHTLDHKMS